MADNRTDEQKALDDEAQAVQDEGRALQDVDQAESSEQGAQLPGQGDEQVTEQPEANPESLVTTNAGVDLSATDTGKNPQVDEAVKSNPNLTAAEQAQLAADPTPQEEAIAAGSNVKSPVGNPTPLQSDPKGMPIDASGLNVTTNQDVIDNFPRNENGQVEIDETGRVVGLDDSNQPAPGGLEEPAEGSSR